MAAVSFCVNCGDQLSGSGMFCTSCGAPIERMSGPGQDRSAGSAPAAGTAPEPEPPSAPPLAGAVEPGPAGSGTTEGWRNRRGWLLGGGIAVAGATAVVAANLLGGSSSDDDGRAAAPTGSPEPTPPVETVEETASPPPTSEPVTVEPSLSEYDPPMTFGQRYALPYGGFLHQVTGDTLYTVGNLDGIVAQDLATGEELYWVDPSQYAGVDLPGIHSLAGDFSEVEGEPTVFVAYEHTEVQGTQPDEEFVRVHAFSLRDGSLMWSQDLDYTESIFDDDVTISELGIVLAADGDYITVSQILGSITHVLRADSGEVERSWDGMVARLLDGKIAVGTARQEDDTYKLEGRDVSTSEVVWSYPVGTSSLTSFGIPDDGLISAITLNEDQGFGVPAVLLDLQLGEELLSYEHPPRSTGNTCDYDGARFLVCSDDEEYLVTYDISRGNQLWERSDIEGGRVLPNVVTAVHNGVIYMDYSDGSREPLAIDAATGDDLIESLPAPFTEVGPGYGMVKREGTGGQITVYPATG